MSPDPMNAVLEAARRKQLRQGNPRSIEMSIASADVARDLADLFAAMGLVVKNPVEAEIWKKQKNEAVDHKGLAVGFQRMGRASNPLADEVCFGEFRKALQRKWAAHRSGRSRRKGANAPPSLDLLQWDRLSPEERSHIRILCGELEAYHRGFVRRSRPRKNALDTLLTQLAELFVRDAEQDRATLALEAAEESHFIQFCHLALAPLSGKGRPFDLSEVSKPALSQRWVRLVKASQAKPPRIQPQGRRSASAGSGQKAK
jgi:hypothetical protein